MMSDRQPSPYTNVNQEIEKMLAEKYEGKVFAQVYMIHMGGTYWVNRDYYFVRDGKVWLIEKDGATCDSKDTLFQLQLDCVIIGKYNPKNKYKSTSREYSYKQVKRLL